MATLASISIQDLRPNPQGNSEFYLANIYQLLANANASHVSIPSTLASPFVPFSPPKYAIWVNSLWFLSLVISLTCALLATLLKQWVRRYVKFTQPRYGPHKRARIRSFFSEGVDKLHLPWAVEALPALLHISVFLFLGGLLIYLFNISLTVFTAVVWWTGFCTAAYACTTLMPIFRHDSPYYTPLSSTVWFLVNGTLFMAFKFLRWLASFRFFSQATWDRFHHKMGRYRRSFLHGMKKAFEESALMLSSEIDCRALMWTFEALDEDHEFEQFFSGIPGFVNSKVVHDPRGAFFDPNGEKLSEALIGFLDRTLSSKLVSRPVKQRRTTIFSKAMEVASLPINWTILDRVLHGEWDGLLDSVDFGLALQRVEYHDPFTTYHAQSAVSITIARVQDHDNRWFELATRQLGLPRSVLQNYLVFGDSALLANCIRICRLTVRAYSEHGWYYRPAASQWKTLEAVSKLDARHTISELQHDFCDLWNEVIQLAHSRDNRRMRSISIDILRHCRYIYIALHRGSDAEPTRFTASTADDDRVLLRKSSYTACNIPGHHVHSAHPNDGLAIGETGEAGTYGAFLSSTHSSLSSRSHAPYLMRTNWVAGSSTQSIQVVHTFLSATDTMTRASEVYATPYPHSPPGVPVPITALYPRDASTLMENEEHPQNAPSSLPIPIIVVSNPLPMGPRPSSGPLLPRIDHIDSGPRFLVPTSSAIPSSTGPEATISSDVEPASNSARLDAHWSVQGANLLAIIEPTHDQFQSSHHTRS